MGRASVLSIFLLFGTNIGAIELETKSRAGDEIAILSVCTSPEAARIFASNPLNKAMRKLERINQACIFRPAEHLNKIGPLGFGVLDKWSSGPHKLGDREFSVWRIKSLSGLYGWTSVYNDEGYHFKQRPI